jgi:hypothetical protein
LSLDVVTLAARGQQLVALMVVGDPTQQADQQEKQGKA